VRALAVWVFVFVNAEALAARGAEAHLTRGELMANRNVVRLVVLIFDAPQADLRAIRRVDVDHVLGAWPRGGPSAGLLAEMRSSVRIGARDELRG
jgi:hypothetical protein